MASTTTTPPPVAPPTISELLRRRAVAKRGAPLYAWVEDEKMEPTVTRELSYGAVDSSVSRVASQLRGPLRPGDRALLVFEPGLLFIRAFFACIRRGVIAVPVYPPNPRVKSTSDAEAFVSIKAGSGATVALTSSTYSWAKKAADFATLDLRGKRWPNDLKWIVVVDDDDSLADDDHQPGGVADDEFFRGEEERTNDIAFLQYTSGSTSAPKGVIVTHGAILHNLSVIVSELRADESTVVVSWLPQFHDMGLVGSLVGVVHCGGRGFYMSPITFVKRPSVWLEAVSKFRGTHMQAPNFAYALAVRKKNVSKQLDLSCAKHFINGAEPIDVDVLDTFQRVFSSKEARLPTGVVFPTYGLAEHVVLVCTNGKGRVSLDATALRERKEVAEGHDLTVIGCGAPHRDVVVRIVTRVVVTKKGNSDDDQGVVVREEQLDEGDLDDEGDVDVEFRDVTQEGSTIGEIWVSSPSVARGYWNLDDGAFGNELDGRTYLRTGDEGFVRDGEVFVCGRIKDLLIVNGKNYYPQDIERVVERRFSAEIRPGCVAAFEHNKGCAVVAEVRETGDDALADRVAKAVATEANVEVSRVVLIKPKTIPKTTSGKIARRRTRAALEKTPGGALLKKHLVVDFVVKTTTTTTTSTRENNSSSRVGPSPGGGGGGVGGSDDPSPTTSSLETRLAEDLAEVGNVDLRSIKMDVPLSGILGSLETAQFAGLLEHKYQCPKLPEDLLYRDDTTLRAVAALVTTFAGKNGADPTPFDDATFHRTIEPLEIETPQTSNTAAPRNKDQPSALVENCPCFLFCCPRRFFRHRNKKKTPRSRDP